MMENVFQLAQNKRIKHASGRETPEQQEKHVAQSHELLASLEDAVNHFVANQGEDLKQSQAKLRDLHQQHHLCLKARRLNTPHES
ncbi:hypothetical protein L4174_021810 [Photobacterium sp. CCB-ST2H9]|uniref:hypothetical protein n=1 Tax=unclassified Photobacterium TaxID=2628852 RepID=UPI00200446EA|nr:hypothetical protein [Photobacterium sp. CCB-ST2H9]UTM59340.1 hypothetical protein L4174_021810 [Photobacterium sp. CCB-ST2H9]